MAQIDLTNCDREPIHIPGRVQSHGFLLAVDKNSYQITYVSDNISDYTSTTADQLLEKPVNNLVSAIESNSGGPALAQILSLGKTQGFDLLTPYKLMVNDQPMYLIMHESGNHLVLEFETATLQYDIQHILG